MRRLRSAQKAATLQASRPALHLVPTVNCRLSTVLDSRAMRSILSNPLPLGALRAGAGYLRRRPGELFTVARNAVGFKLTVPLDALRWLIDNLPKGPKSPKDVT